MAERSHEPPYPDQKYEYKVVKLDWMVGGRDEWLNKQARGGWKLVEVLPANDSLMIFEREVKD